ncbi:MAG: DUF4832 domain-containing protein [Paludibacteraceae bacterium]
MNQRVMLRLGVATALCLLFGMQTLPVSAQQESGWKSVALQRQITHVQPMTGLVLWRDNERMSQYQHTVSLEFHYCLPCRVVTGKTDGKVDYDWTYLEEILNDIRSRGHQAILRFRYEYPDNTEVDGKRGTTAVPQYIKDGSDYHETYSANPGGDGPTYYADWSNAELQWFTRQFYTDFAARYNDDPRIAFLEVGFGHWSEYHIYGTKLQLGTNFPSKDYQAAFLQHLDTTLRIPWAISIDAADDSYTPIAGSEGLMALHFGLFDDSFMHEEHEIGSGDGYNEECWNVIGGGTRWQRGVCGGEISYYTSKDQKNFLNPAGMYGVTWEAAAAKYHISFMIANDAPGSTYGTVDRFAEAAMATGYRLLVTRCETNGGETRLTVCNEGVAPLYRDAYFAVDTVVSGTTLRGLLPGEQREITIPAALTDGEALHVVSPCILPSQEIEFRAGTVQDDLPAVAEDAKQAGRKEIRDGQVVILYRGETYLLSGARR